jgi:hypothetical protein
MQVVVPSVSWAATLQGRAGSVTRDRPSFPSSDVPVGEKGASVARPSKGLDGNGLATVAVVSPAPGAVWPLGGAVRSLSPAKAALIGSAATTTTNASFLINMAHSLPINVLH